MAKRRPKRVQFDLRPDAPAPRSGDFDELFSAEGGAAQRSTLEIREVRLDAIAPDAEQPRQTLNDEGLNELAASIAQEGVIQPIELVQVARDRYRIVHGERRWRAAGLAGLETIPAIVRRRDYDKVTRFVRQMVENMQREDLNDVDRALGLQHVQELMQEELNALAERGEGPWSSKASWAKVGERLGLSRQRIHQLKNLLDLPRPILDDVRLGALTERETRPLRQLAPAQQMALHEAWRLQEITSQEMQRAAKLLGKGETASVRQAIATARGGGRQRAGRPVVDQLARIHTRLDALSMDGLTPEDAGTTLALLQDIEYTVQTMIDRLVRDS